jgi:hypothetical protein
MMLEGVRNWTVLALVAMPEVWLFAAVAGYVLIARP